MNVVITKKKHFEEEHIMIIVLLYPDVQAVRKGKTFR